MRTHSGRKTNSIAASLPMPYRCVMRVVRGAWREARGAWHVRRLRTIAPIRTMRICLQRSLIAGRRQPRTHVIASYGAVCLLLRLLLVRSDVYAAALVRCAPLAARRWPLAARRPSRTVNERATGNGASNVCPFARRAAPNRRLSGSCTRHN